MSNLLASDSKSLFQTVKTITGLRISPRLWACYDVVRLFGDTGGFGRYEILHPANGLVEAYGERLLERALSCLSSSGLLSAISKRSKQGGGQIFVINNGCTQH